MPTFLTSTTSPDITGTLTTWLNKNFVSDLEYALQFQKFTTKAIVPKNSGRIGRFLAWAPPTFPSSYSASSRTTFEGSTTANEFTAITVASTNITIAEIGEFTQVGSLWEYAAVAGSRQKILKRLKDGAAFTIDGLVRDAASNTTFIRYATNNSAYNLVSAGPSNVSTLSASGIIQAKSALFNNLAQGFEGIEGHPSGHMAAILTAKQELDVVTEISTTRTYWTQCVVNVPGREGQGKWVNGYMGSIYGVACYVTNNYSTVLYTASAEVGYILADGGVGCMAFEDMNPEIIINPRNSPYNNLNYMSWHSMFGCGLIDTNRVLKIYSLT